VRSRLIVSGILSWKHQLQLRFVENVEHAAALQKKNPFLVTVTATRRCE
jgi:hypothetical protein